MNDIAARLEQKLSGLKQRFLTCMPQRLDGINDSLRARALRDVERAFHSLAGTAATYGVHEVAALARSGEDVCTRTQAIDDDLALVLAAIVGELRSAGARGRVLCVDDDPDQLAYVEEILRSAGYDVTGVTTAAAFALTLGSFRPDLVIMDMLLPETSGADLVRDVRSDQAYATLPIVFLTGERRMSSRIEALKVGGDDYLIKPVDPELLVSVVESRLKHAQTMRAMIDHDPLTGVLLRSAFLRRAAAVAGSARRRQAPAAYVMLDLDHFKSINDGFGHAMGDKVLTSFTSFLKSNLRSGDDVGRVGGEEFALLLPDISSEDVQSLITRLLVDFSHIVHHTPSATLLLVTFSAGVAMLEEKDDLHSWSRRADEALYVAKRGGRARVEAA